MKCGIVHALSPFLFLCTCIVTSQVQAPSPVSSAEKPKSKVANVSFATEDGGVVYADLYGSGESGVVLAHGGRFTKESWQPQAEKLAAEIEFQLRKDPEDKMAVPLRSKLEAASGLFGLLGSIDEAIEQTEAAAAKDRANAKRIELQREMANVRAEVAKLVEMAERLGAKEKEALTDALACLSSDR